MRALFDCLHKVENQQDHSDGLSNASKLRQILKQNLFLLGIESHNNKSLLAEKKFHQMNQKRLVMDKVTLDEKRKEKETKLAQAQA